MTHSNSPTLDQASDDIKLAVDLIYLLETHQLPTETVLKALAIVQADFEKKQASEQAQDGIKKP